MATDKPLSQQQQSNRYFWAQKSMALCTVGQSYYYYYYYYYYYRFMALCLELPGTERMPWIVIVGGSR